MVWRMLRCRQLPWIMAACLLAGCGGQPKGDIFAKDGPTTEQVWRGASERSVLLDDRFGVGTGEFGPWTRSADRELMSLFPELPNPRMLLYVFPHLSADGAPVPGYSTAFYLYTEAGLFALPGEALREGVLR